MLLSDGTFDALSKGQPLEPVEEESQPLQRSLSVRETALVPKTVLRDLGVPEKFLTEDCNTEELFFEYSKGLAAAAETEQHVSEDDNDVNDDEMKDFEKFHRDNETLYCYVRKRQKQLQRKQQQQQQQQQMQN